MNRRYLMVGSYTPTGPRRYVTITVGVTPNSNLQYYDGTIKTFTSTVTINSSPTYTNFRVTIKNTKTITESAVGTYYFNYTENDFNVNIPSDGYEYILTWNIANPAVQIMIDDRKITQDAAFNNYLIRSAGDAVAPLATTVINVNPYLGNFYKQSLGHAFDNLVEDPNYDSSTSATDDYAILLTQYIGANSSYSNFKIQFAGDNNYYSLKEAVQKQYLKPIVFIQYYKIPNVGINVSNIYGVYTNTTVTGGSSPEAQGNSIYIMCFTNGKHLSDIRSFNSFQQKSIPQYQITYGLADVDQADLTLYERGLDDIITVNGSEPIDHSMDSIYGNYHTAGLPTFPTTNILSLNPATSYNYNTLSLYNQTCCLEFIRNTATVATNLFFDIAIDFVTYTGTAGYAPNITPYSLYEATQLGLISPIVIIQGNASNGYSGYEFTDTLMNAKTSGSAGDEKCRIEIDADTAVSFKIYFTLTARTAMKGIFWFGNSSGAKFTSVSLYYTDEANYKLDYVDISSYVTKNLGIGGYNSYMQIDGNNVTTTVSGYNPTGNFKYYLNNNLSRITTTPYNAHTILAIEFHSQVSGYTPARDPIYSFSASSFKLNFANGKTYSFAEAVNKHFIEPIVLISTQSFDQTDQQNLYRGGSFSIPSYQSGLGSPVWLYVVCILRAIPVTSMAFTKSYGTYSISGGSQDEHHLEYVPAN